jgi:hypothetical protein
MKFDKLYNSILKEEYGSRPMKKIMKFGYMGLGGVEKIEKEVEIIYNSERELVKKCLIEYFGSVEKCLEYWKDFDSGMDSIEKIVEKIIGDKKELGDDFYMLGGEEFCKE